MNPLLFLAFVGVAGESPALLQAPLVLSPGRDDSSILAASPTCALKFYLPRVASLLPLLGLFLSLASLTFCLTPLPAPSFIHLWALFGEAGKRDQVKVVHEINQ